MPQFLNPVCVALDTKDGNQAYRLAAALSEHVGLVKVGMEFFYANGAAGYQAIAKTQIPVFLDLKLHDIPNTVGAGLASLMNLSPPPAIVNVHATGGPAMMQAAVEAVAGRARVIAVTILTSLSNEDLASVGFADDRDTAQRAVELARLARDCGMDGVVCSPLDISAIKAACGQEFITVVPGIRPGGTTADDQKRIATPRAAIAAGADIIVIGRPITRSDDPVAAAQRIVNELRRD